MSDDLDPRMVAAFDQELAVVDDLLDGLLATFAARKAEHGRTVAISSMFREMRDAIVAGETRAHTVAAIFVGALARCDDLLTGPR